MKSQRHSNRQDSGSQLGHGVRYLLHSFNHNRWLVFLATTASWVVVAAELGIPLLTRDAVDIATGQQPPSEWLSALLPDTPPVKAIVILLVVIAGLRFIFQVCRRYTSTTLSLGIQHSLRLDVLRALHQLDGPGYRSIEPGQVMSRSISDLNAIQRLIAMYSRAIGNLTKFLGIIAVMVWIQPFLAALALLFVPVTTYITWKSRSSMYAANWSGQQIAGELAEHVTETLSGIRIVKAFTQEEREIERLQSTSRRLFAHRLRSAKVTARYQPLVDQIPQIALVLNIVVGGLLALQGSITVGTFFAFSTYLTQLSVVSRGLSLLVMRYQLAAASIDRIGEILDIPAKTSSQSHSAPITLTDSPVGLEIHHVSFSTEGRHILTDMSFRVKPGETVTITGGPGAGKSMLVQLLGQFYQPDSGSICLISKPVQPSYPSITEEPHVAQPSLSAGTDVSGSSEELIDIATCDPAFYSSIVALVFDEPFLYSASIRENIALGGAYSEEELWHALEIAEARDFVERLAEGLDTRIGEKGLTLSGGQRQRIALARALVRRPRILILDDATSAIDAATEARILSNLRTDLRNVTVVAITHRSSLLQLSDRQIRLEHGKIVQVSDNPENLDIWDATLSEECEPSDIATPGMWDTRAVAPPQVPATSDSNAALDTQNPALVKALQNLPPATDEPSLDITETLSLRGMLRAVRWWIAGVILLLILGVGADLAFPSLMRWAIDGAVASGDTSQLWQIAAVAAGVIILAWGTAYLKSLWTVRTGEEVLYGLRVRSFGHLLKLSMDYFESTMVGKILTRMTTDIDALSSFLQTGLAQTIVSLSSLIGISIMLLVTNVTLASLALLSIPVIAIATFIFHRVSSRLYRTAREQVSEVNAIFAEALSALPTAQAYNITQMTEQKLERASSRYKTLRARGVFATAIYFPGLNAISSITQALILGLGVGYTVSSEMSIGVVVGFIMYMGNLFTPIQELGEVFDSWQQASVGVRRISDLLNERPTVINNPDSDDVLNKVLNQQPSTDGGTDDNLIRYAARGAIATENVTFGYSQHSAPITRNLTLELRPGQTVALVGPTGAGKSTIIKLLARFYDPLSGKVTASDVDIRRFDIHAWRGAIGLVPQEPYLFRGTVADNISYGKPEATSSEIVHAVEAVGAQAALANLPQGLNTDVKDLSSGQRQLVALARAQLKNPPLMLLDEATATLDIATEKQVLHSTRALTAQRTSVIVAHRLSTAEQADRILVVEDGKITEDGNHEELLNLRGTYHALWQAWVRTGGTSGGSLSTDSSCMGL